MISGPVTPTTPSLAVPQKRAYALPEPLAAIALLVLAIAFAALLLARPRAVSPTEVPALVLPAGEVARVLAADQRSASKAPHSVQAESLRALLRTQGEVEVRGHEDADEYHRRRQKLAEGYASLVAADGEQAAMCLRAEATQELEAALDLKLSLAKAKVVLGAMPAVFEREGVTHDGELIAPRFVAHTLFKARWNLLHGLAPDQRFEPIEKRTYYGWKALHAQGLPMPTRVAALQKYAKLGGAHADEALGVLLFSLQEYEQAAVPLQAAYRADPSLRLRNYLLGARSRAGYQD